VEEKGREGREREGRGGRGEGKGEGMGREGKGWEERRGQEGVRNLRKTTPVIRWLVTGLQVGKSGDNRCEHICT